MRICEFITESRTLNEGKMTPKEWSKEKYVESLVDGIRNNQSFSFEYPKGNKFTGYVADPKKALAAIESARSAGGLSSKLVLPITVIDEETLEPTGEVIQTPVTAMFKDEKIKGELVPNMGNIAEALLGCAVAAKFAKNGQTITEHDLVSMGRQLAQNRGTLETKAGKDTLIFKVSIPFMDKKAFYSWLNEDSRGKTLQDYNVSDKIIALFEQRANAALEYANTSKRVSGAVQQAQEDPKNNKVEVVSDGGEKENQSTTKVDLKILIDGKETAKRLLSVKAGVVSQVGQVSGVNFSHARDFFSSVGVVLPDAIQKYFHEVPPKARGTEDQKLYNFENGFSKAFQQAYSQLQKRASSDQEGLVEDVYQGLLHHLTRKEPGVEMVILDPGGKKAFRELSFGPEFEKALRQLQLVVTQSDRESTYNISIYGFPVGTVAKKFVPSRKDADSKLIDLTSKFKDGTIRNTIEMGNLLKNIADIENYIEQAQPQQTQEPVQQQAKPDELDAVRKNAGLAKPATSPKPALKVSQPKISQPPPTTGVKKTVGPIGSK